MNVDTVVCSDAFAFMDTLPDKSVDMIFIDPPYNVTELEFETAIDWYTFWLHARRILKLPKSPTLIFSQQPFTTDLINSNRKGYRLEIIIHKSMPTGFLDANRRPLRCHENLIVFADKMPDYWPEFEASHSKRTGTQFRTGLSAHYKPTGASSWDDNGTRYPRSVWHTAQRHNAFENTKTLHPTEKPLDVCMKAIKLWSQPGWTVLDCFCGSGTTGAAAMATKRHFLMCDINPEYVELAYNRCRELPGDSPIAPGIMQLSMFNEAKENDHE